MNLFVLIFVKGTLCAPNFVFVLTDDQDLLLKGLTPMKNTLKLIASNGMVFKNAYVNSPICCPSRSTTLTGKYLHNTHVLNNSIAGGCSSSNWQINHEPFTVSAILNSNNYKTFYAGKYLNQYGTKEAGSISHIPKGYDWWVGLKGNSKYFNYTLSINGTKTDFSNKYLTDLINEYALSFLNENSAKEKPFFMILAPPAPHSPFTPPDRHKNKYPNLKLFKNPAFNHSSADKHWLINNNPRVLPENISILDDIYRKRFQTLLSVDEMIKNIVTQLKKMKCFNNTYFIFTSDNGFHIGQYAMPWDKRLPYETDIHVPFIISGPKIKSKSISHFPISAVDFAPTILDLANVTIPNYMDGNSFKSILMNPKHKIRERFLLVEYYGEGDANTISENCPEAFDNDVAECTLENWCKCQDSKNNTYTCIRHFAKNYDYKYCHFQDNLNFVEAYNLQEDPYELRNLNNQLTSKQEDKYEKIIQKLKDCIGVNCRY